MANVFDVANFFIDVVQKSEDDQITNLKLNKLMYYAQGAYLARTGKQLFSEEIEAWDLGPVVPVIYRKYKPFGRRPIECADEEYDPHIFSEDELDVLTDVMREFGKYTGSTLVTLTHRKGTPWSITSENGERAILPSSIRDYFLRNPVKAFSPDHDESVNTFPADWYNPEEDAVWEAYL